MQSGLTPRLGARAQRELCVQPRVSVGGHVHEFAGVVPADLPCEISDEVARFEARYRADPALARKQSAPHLLDLVPERGDKTHACDDNAT